jgi:hypothetical protein
MKYVRTAALALGLILLALALTIMFRQTIGRHKVGADPVYVQDVPEYITLGDWPSGKAPGSGPEIGGSNPSSPAKLIAAAVIASSLFGLLGGILLGWLSWKVRHGFKKETGDR